MSEYNEEQIIKAIELGLQSNNIEHQKKAIALAESIKLSFISIPYSQSNYKDVIDHALETEIELYLKDKNLLDNVLSKEDITKLDSRVQRLKISKERKDFVNNFDKLRAVLSSLPGVDPDDPTFHDF